MTIQAERLRRFLRPRLLPLALASLAATLAACSAGNGETAAAASRPGTPVTASVVVERAIVPTQEFSG